MQLLDMVKNIIQAGASAQMTDRQFITMQIKQWMASQTRHMQIAGERYLRGQHDILKYQQTAIGKNGRPITVSNIPNAKIVDNQYARMVKQKTNYILSKAPTFSSENKAYMDAINSVFDSGFVNQLKHTAEDAITGGLAWLMPYYDEEGTFRFREIPAYHVLPFWANAEHTKLDAAIYMYKVETWEGLTKKIVPHIQVYTTQGVFYFNFEDGVLRAEEPWQTSYATMGETPVNWDRIPLIAFKYNAHEEPLISRVKSLQDAINTMESNFENGMLESPRNTIMVLVNYDGEDLSEFRQNLATYGAVKVRSTDGVSGDVRTLQVAVNAENYRVILALFKQALIENASGYDAKDERLAGNPNQMNIQSMYSDLDLDADGIEAEFKASFQQLKFFVDAHLANAGLGNFTEDAFKVSFNRSVLINTGELIANIRNSMGFISNKTLLEKHPFVSDVDEELKRLKQEKREQEDEAYYRGGVVNAESTEQ